ncbi:MAG: hypothetical protein ABMA64_38960, partial [Myxococcota bacterium]
MRHARWLLATVMAGTGLAAALGWFDRAGEAVSAAPPAPLPRAPAAAPQVVVPADAWEVPRGPDPGRTWLREPREFLADAHPASTPLGALAQRAMSRRGDTDPRLLDALAGLGRVGLGPAAVAGWGAAVDPWVAVALVDLERQLARRCDARGEPSCWDRALELEGSVPVDDPSAEWALAAFAAYDQGVARPERRCEAQADWLARGDARLVELVGEPCTAHVDEVRARLDREQPADFDGWSRFAAVASAVSAPDAMARAVDALAVSARGARQRELAAYWRARAVAAGWVPPADGRDALGAGVVACAPEG